MSERYRLGGTFPLLLGMERAGRRRGQRPRRLLRAPGDVPLANPGRMFLRLSSARSRLAQACSSKMRNMTPAALQDPER